MGPNVPDLHCANVYREGRDWQVPLAQVSGRGSAAAPSFPWWLAPLAVWPYDFLQIAILAYQRTTQLSSCCVSSSLSAASFSRINSSTFVANERTVGASNRLRRVR